MNEAPPLRRQQSYNFIRWRRYLGIGLIIFFIVGLLYAARISRFYSAISTQKEIWGSVLPQKKTTYTFLVMGYGGPGHEGAYLTDTMMVGQVDTKTKKILVVSLPRDIWVAVPTKSGEELALSEVEGFHSKINAVYQMGLFPKNYPDIPKKYHNEQGAADLVKYVAGAIVGFPIDYYIAVDFDGFKKAVDRLGGVEISVERTFTDLEYPINGKEDDTCGYDETTLVEKLKEATEEPRLAFPCRYETLHFNSGIQMMSGEQALKYVRSRHAVEDGGDFGRARRQQRFLEAVQEKVLAIGFIPKILPLLDDLENHIRIDVPFDITEKFLKEADNAGEYTITQLVLTPDNFLMSSYSKDRQYILVPKTGVDRWGQVNKEIEMMIQGITPTPTKE